MASTQTETVLQTENIPKLPQDIGTDYTFKRRIVWKNVLGFIVLHLAALYGLYLALFKAKAVMFFYGGFFGHQEGELFLHFCDFLGFFLAFISGEGITVGAHRLYSHKTFKAKFATRLGLMILQTMAGQVRESGLDDLKQFRSHSDSVANNQVCSI